MNASQTKSGLLEKVKNFFSPDNLTQRFNLTKGRLIEMALYLLLGFVVGYLLKKYSKLVFTFAVVCLVLIVLQQLDLISLTFNWAKLQQLVGIQPVNPAPDTDLLNAFWIWIQANIGLVISFILGFLIGLRLG